MLNFQFLRTTAISQSLFTNLKPKSVNKKYSARNISYRFLPGTLCNGHCGRGAGVGVVAVVVVAAFPHHFDKFIKKTLITLYVTQDHRIGWADRRVGSITGPRRTIFTLQHQSMDKSLSIRNKVLVCVDGNVVSAAVHIDKTQRVPSNDKVLSADTIKFHF